MLKIAVLYATREGHTRKIARYAAAELRGNGHLPTLRDIASLEKPFSLDGYDAAIVLASVHGGKHEHEVVRFVKSRRRALESMPTAFLSVSLSEATVEDPKRTPEQRAQAEKDVAGTLETFYGATGWRPTEVKPVAGALLYTRYGFFVRFVMKSIARRAGGPTDTSRNYEFTDWDALDRFVDDFVDHVRARKRQTAAATV